jgi:hypothetical protein
MRSFEILNEKPVESAWITDLIYNRPNKVLTMRISNGRSFSVAGITRAMFERWIKAPSKGSFFHQYIKDTYKVKRIK